MSNKNASTEDPQAVALEDPAEGTADLAAEPDAEPDAALPDIHVIKLLGPDGFELVHPVTCWPRRRTARSPRRQGGSAVPCARQRPVDVRRQRCGLVLLERIGD